MGYKLDGLSSQFYRIFEIIIVCFVVDICDLVHDVEAVRFSDAVSSKQRLCIASTLCTRSHVLQTMNYNTDLVSLALGGNFNSSRKFSYPS